MESKQAPPPSELSRRRFYGVMSTGFLAIVGIGTLAGPTGMLLDPLLRKKENEDGRDNQFQIGRIDRFVVGGAPTRIVIRKTIKDGWLTRSGVPIGAVLVQRLKGDDFRVFSSTCPHLACAVTPNPKHNRYHCPCHNSAFTFSGQATANPDGKQGPSPRGLDPLPWNVKNGVLFVTWKRFQTNIADRLEIG
jgi:menaquinol-cytochrome c reductase iron-sulfur subunit